MNAVEMLNQNEELQKKINEAKTPNEIAAILSQYGINMTVADVEDALREAELGEADLDNVSGGGSDWIFKINPVYWVCKWLTQKALGNAGVC